MGLFTPTTQAISEEQLKAFLEAVKADAGLQEQLKAAGDAEAVVAIAKDLGFMISAEELEISKELSEDGDLESVTGGGFDPKAFVNRGIYDLEKLAARFK